MLGIMSMLETSGQLLAAAVGLWLLAALVIGGLWQAGDEWRLWRLRRRWQARASEVQAALAHDEPPRQQESE